MVMVLRKFRCLEAKTDNEDEEEAPGHVKALLHTASLKVSVLSFIQI